MALEKGTQENREDNGSMHESWNTEMNVLN